MSRRFPCLDKLEDLAGFRPKPTLPEIVDHVIAHFGKKDELFGMCRVADENAVGVDSATKSVI
jgi:hypothetical protein